MRLEPHVRTVLNRHTVPFSRKPVFGVDTRTDQTPQFIAPMVVANAPAYNPTQPQTLAYYKNLVEIAKTFSQPAITGRQVGLVAVGKSGRAYLGTNIEVKGSAPADTIHAEVFALALARHYGEMGIVRIFQSLQPCGPCRQVVRELGNPGLPVHIFLSPQKPLVTRTIYELFPVGYSYANNTLNMLNHPYLTLPATGWYQKWPNPMLTAAVNSGLQSYQPNPNRKTWSGLIVQLANGKKYTGNAITISGPNPTITPLQDALIKIVADKGELRTIRQVVMVESRDPDYSFIATNKALLKKIAPNATVATYTR